MTKTTRSNAERLFSARESKENQFVKEKARAEKARADNVARLRELRLAKEAAEAAQTKK